MRRPTIVLSAALLVGAACLPARADADKAVADFKAGRYLDAAAEMQAIVDRSPGYDDGYYLIGLCMLRMGHPTEAENQFRRAIDIQPNRPAYYHGLGEALKAKADWARTIQATSEGLAHNPDPLTKFLLLKLRGSAWGALRRWGPAVRDLEAARRIKEEPSVLVTLAIAYFSTGAYSAAIPPLLTAMQQAPEDPTALRLLAESYLRIAGGETDPVKKQSEYVQSLEYARRLASVVQNNLEAIHLIGRAALGAGRLSQAESVFRYVLAHDPHQCYAMVNLGRTYFAAEQWAEAEVYLRRAAICAPRMGVVYETLGELYLRRGMTQAAAEAFRRAEEIDPTDLDPEAYGAERHNTPGSIPVSTPR